MSYETEAVNAIWPTNVGGLPICGKYGPSEQPAYELRRKLMAAGLQVSFPLGEKPIEHFSGYTFSTRDEERMPFDVMQEIFFLRIEKSPYLIVASSYLDADGQLRKGRLGFSAAHEVCYAIANKKAIVATHTVEEISKYVPQILFDTILQKKEQFVTQDLLKLTTEQLNSFLKGLPEKVEYNLTAEQEEAIFRVCDKLIQIEHHRWRSWKEATNRYHKQGLRPNHITEPGDEDERNCEDPAYYLPRDAIDEDQNDYVHLK